MEVFPEPVVVAAAMDAIRIGAVNFDSSPPARRRGRRCLRIICVSSSFPPSCANMRRLPGRPRARYRSCPIPLASRRARTHRSRKTHGRAAHPRCFDSFDFVAIPSLNKPLVLELARYEYVVARENVIALGNSGAGKTHVALALGLAAR
jgi:hypothetical protein